LQEKVVEAANPIVDNCEATIGQRRNARVLLVVCGV
jgi:hypothetical protein